MRSAVTIIVVTYNSSPFIIETLDSIYNQTWREIELIVTDDCSKDETVSVIQAWLDANTSRFVSTQLITVPSNTGVSANANRGLKEATSEWIKYIGGDDTLNPNCIEDCMHWISDHPKTRILFSKVDLYKNDFQPQNYLKTIPGHPYAEDGIFGASKDAATQYQMLLIADRIHFTPGVIVAREAFLSVGGYDESHRLLEDYPMWLKLTKAGYQLYFMDKITVNYRRHEQAINNTGGNFLVNPNYFKNIEFRRQYILPNLPIDLKLSQQFKWITSQIFRAKWLNVNNRSSNLLHKLITHYLNPFEYVIWLNKKLNHNLKNSEFYK